MTDLTIDRIPAEGLKPPDLRLARLGGIPFQTLLADPPWRFQNRTGKIAPEHKRLSRYETMSLTEIAQLPVADLMADQSHCYLWVPNAMVSEGLSVLSAWGFGYKSLLVWHKVRKDGGSDARGVGFYFRNVTELVLFGVRGKLRTRDPARRQVNLIATRKREHSRKPDELYPIIEACSWGPYLEIFARHPRCGWASWGDEVVPPEPQLPADRSPRPGRLDQQAGSQLRLIEPDHEVERACEIAIPPPTQFPPAKL